MMAKELFLSNEQNKHCLIQRLEAEQFVVKLAAGDAGILIVTSAVRIAHAQHSDSMFVIKEVTDLLVN